MISIDSIKKFFELKIKSLGILTASGFATLLLESITNMSNILLVLSFLFFFCTLNVLVDFFVKMKKERKKASDDLDRIIFCSDLQKQILVDAIKNKGRVVLHYPSVDEKFAVEVLRRKEIIYYTQHGMAVKDWVLPYYDILVNSTSSK